MMSLTHALTKPHTNRPSKSRSRHKPHRKKANSFLQNITGNALPSTGHSKRLRVVGIAAGAASVAGSVAFALSHGISPTAAASGMVVAAQASAYAPIIYSAGAIILPALFVSQTVMTVTGGVLFGPVQGVLLSLTAQTLSAMLAYGIGEQLIKRTSFGSSLTKRIEPYIGRLRRDPLQTMMLMRLFYLPQEAVSYASGMLDVGWKPLIVGTILGSLPSTIFLVQVGNAIGSGLGGAVAFNPVALALSGGALVGSILIANRMKSAEPSLIDDEINDGNIIDGEIIDNANDDNILPKR